MLTISDKNIILGSMGGVSLPDGWGAGWLAPPAIVDNGDDTGTINGYPNAMLFLCNMLPNSPNSIRTYVNSTGTITISSYTDIAGSPLATQNATGAVTLDTIVNHASLVNRGHKSDARQVWVLVTSTKPLIECAITSNSGIEYRPYIDAVIVCNSVPFSYTLATYKSLSYMRIITPTTTAGPFSGFYSPPAESTVYSTTSSPIPQISYDWGIRFLDFKYPNSPSFATVDGFLSVPYVQTVILTAPKVRQNGLKLFEGMTQLVSCLMPDFKSGFSVKGCSMSAAALDALSGSLGAAYTTGQILDYRNNPGSATCNTSIAMAKGYTVLTA